MTQRYHDSTKYVSFSVIGHKHVQTILAKSLKSDTSVAGCFHWILQDPRILVCFISFECCIKTRICRFPLPVCNFQCSQGNRFFMLVTSCSIISYHCSVLVSDLHGRTNVGWLSDFKDYALTSHKNRAKIPYPCLSALNMVRRARWSHVSAVACTHMFVELTRKLFYRIH